MYIVVADDVSGATIGLLVIDFCCCVLTSRLISSAYNFQSTYIVVVVYTVKCEHNN